MRQHITLHQWGEFERAHPKGASSLRIWLDALDYPQSPTAYVSYVVEPAAVRLTIGRCIQFLDEHSKGWIIGDSERRPRDQRWEVMKPHHIRPDRHYYASELIDALWEACRTTLEEGATE